MNVLKFLRVIYIKNTVIWSYTQAKYSSTEKKNVWSLKKDFYCLFNYYNTFTLNTSTQDYTHISSKSHILVKADKKKERIKDTIEIFWKLSVENM